MKKFIVFTCIVALAACGSNNQNTNDMNLTQEWDKTFPKSELVSHSKVGTVGKC